MSFLGGEYDEPMCNQRAQKLITDNRDLRIEIIEAAELMKDIVKLGYLGAGILNERANTLIKRGKELEES